MTFPNSERFLPNPQHEPGVALAENYDGRICGSEETFTGEPCQVPARWGREDVEDPEGDTACHRHAPDVDRCGARTIHGGSDATCLLPAGHGTDRDHGPCDRHSEAARRDKRIKQAEFLLELSKTLTISRAAEAVGIARYTVYQWMDQYLDFGEAVARLMNDHVAAKRLQVAEERLFERVADDRGSSAERIFYLVNASAGGEGWRDVKLVKHQHDVSGGVLMVPGGSESMDEWEDEAREEQERLEEETPTGREIEVPNREPPPDD